MTTQPALSICAPALVEVHSDRRVLPHPWYVGEERGPWEQQTCEKCRAFVRVTSRTFELRFYDESTCGAYDGWYVVGEHYSCTRCRHCSRPEKEPEREQ